MATYTQSQGVPVAGVPISGTPVSGTPILDQKGQAIAASQGVPITASAPDVRDLGPPPGYEALTFDAQPLAPPSYFDANASAPERSAFDIPAVSEDEVRSSLVSWATEKCCYGAGAARELAINQIQMTSSYHYTLETFTERRETSWQFAPYDGVSPFDGPHNGPAPAAWDIIVNPRQDFAKHDVITEVPHTSNIRICHGCGGRGRNPCSSCGGIGTSICWNCGGSGHHHEHHHDSDGHHRDEHRTCLTCMGTGRSRCMNCGGTGIVDCVTCNTMGKLRYYIQLHVKWENHGDDFVSDATGLKVERIKRVQGFFAIDEVQPRAFPLEGFPDRSIADASKMMLEKHGKEFPFEKILKQRQAVKVVPIAVVYYKHKDNEGNFYVYGHESDRQVYFEDYPQRCCWLCSIL